MAKVKAKDLISGKYYTFDGSVFKILKKYNRLTNNYIHFDIKLFVEDEFSTPMILQSVPFHPETELEEFDNKLFSILYE